MKILATIEARVGSSRLPGKVLRPILGRPMLELMIERVRQASNIKQIVLATSRNTLDDPLEALALRLGIGCYRGSEDDVLDRVLQAAKTYKAEHIVELWGDTPLIDPQIIDQAVHYYLNNNYDCIGTCLDKKFPWGMSLLIFSTAVLDEVSKITDDPVDRENVSSYIYGHPERYKIGHLPCPKELQRPEIRLTVDEQPDLELVETIFEHFAASGTVFSTIEIIQFLDSHPDIKNINRMVKQKKLR